MATPTVPINGIIASGRPPIINQLSVESGTTLYPGGLVISGTAVTQVVTCPVNGNAIGWAGYEDTSAIYTDGQDVDELYTTGDEIAVLSGGGFEIYAHLANGQSVAKGDRLCAAAAGELTAAVAATVTIASGSTTVVSDKAQPDEAVAGSVGAQGIVVAIAKETVNASGGALPIIVQSLI